MTVLTNVIYTVSIHKDVWDYAGIIGTAIAPIIAIVFSIWNNLQIKKLRSEDQQRDMEIQERTELRHHYQEINKFIDDQLYFLPSMSDQDFTSMIIKLQNFINKCGMISRNEIRDKIVYYLSTYVEIAYFILTDFDSATPDELLNVKKFFLNSIKEFDIPLINKEQAIAHLRLEQFSAELRVMCRSTQI